MNQSKNAHVFLIVAAAVLAGMMIMAGCSDKDDPVRVEPDPPIGPESPDELVIQFLAAYEARDLEEYLALLDPDYLTLLSEITTEDFPDLGATLDLDEEMRIHERMFSGINVVDPDGNVIPAVKTINVTVFHPLGAWSPSDDEDSFPDAVWAPFDVQILFDRGQEYWTSKVEGLVKIYARSHEVMVGDTKTTYYLMVGMKDLTGVGKGSENSVWGSVKALYR